MQKTTQNNPASPNAPPKKRRRGCLVALLVTALVLLLITAVIVGAVSWRYRTFRDDFTDAALQDLPVQQTEPAQARRLSRTLEDMQRAAREGTHETFAFTGEQLNKMVASLPEARGRAHFTIVDDRLKVKAGIPLDQVPGFEGRFLNGEFTLKVSLADNQLDIDVLEATVRGQKLPAAIVNHLNTMNIADRAMQNQQVQKHLRGIESIRIENDKLIVETGKQ